MPDLTTAFDIQDDKIVCQCGASSSKASKELKRFLKRHPAKCSERREFSKQLAEGTRSVDADENAPQIINDQWVGKEEQKPKGWRATHGNGPMNRIHQAAKEG